MAKVMLLRMKGHDGIATRTNGLLQDSVKAIQERCTLLSGSLAEQQSWDATLRAGEPKSTSSNWMYARKKAPNCST